MNKTNQLTIPELALVVLIGASGSGKTTFARKHFAPTEIISSDYCRAIVSDDENNQDANNDAYEVLNFIVTKRLARGLLTVIDATNVQVESRKSLIALARQYHTFAVAIVLNMPESLCLERNQTRTDRTLAAHVITRQQREMRRSMHGLEREGFRYVFALSSPEQVEAASIRREPLWNNRKSEHGPFDIIGDVHGCYAELCDLLVKLGYQIAEDGVVTPPPSRKAIFLGDLVDRGPDMPAVLNLVMGMVAAGTALCVPGNHDMKLVRKLSGKDVRVSHGMAQSLEQLERYPADFSQKVAAFLDGLISHYVLDDGKLVVAHAGLPAAMQGRGSGQVREFALFGETTGETDEFGLPVRYNWAADYRGAAMVVYGHTPIPQPEWLNNTINIDTGCVFGGVLTALRYPERELVSVPARAVYAEARRPFLPPPDTAPTLTAQQANDDVLNLEDVIGRRQVETRLNRRIIIRAENAAAALEAMSRWAINPRWLIYLPPTMSPSETSSRDGFLEHPAEAFDYFRLQGVQRVICEEKHMGSRAVVIVCRDTDTARRRFGVAGEGIGVCYTRTGRRFFTDAALEAAFLAHVADAIGAAGLWEALQTDWLCLDAELMPWSAKAQDLIREQYAAVGAGASMALRDAIQWLGKSGDPALVPILERTTTRAEMIDLYINAYRRYCWPINSLQDYRLAPFHVLASEGKTYFDRDHLWHMEIIQRLCAAGAPILHMTPYRLIDVNDPTSTAEGITWWESLTEQGGEGMVVKPLDFITMGTRYMVQPALKIRGREYLRIIYGAEYTLPANLDRLRRRALASKRTLALREFALGVEGLERFARGEPLRRVHECAFAVLALESEPIDPRL